MSTVRATMVRGPALEVLRCHLPADVLTLTQCQRHNGQGGVGGSRGAERAAVRNKQVLDVVRLAPGVRDAVTRIRAHPRRAHVVCRRWSEAPDDTFGADRLIHLRRLVLRMLA